jgi:hypothetical protein
MLEGCGSIKSHLKEARRIEDVVQDPRVRYLVYPKPDTRNLG